MLRVIAGVAAASAIAAGAVYATEGFSRTPQFLVAEPSASEMLEDPAVQDAMREARQEGRANGYDSGYADGHADGVVEGAGSATENYNEGYNVGYDDGLNDAVYGYDGPSVTTFDTDDSDGCDANYSGACIPDVGYDLDCPDVFATDFFVTGYDNHGFDADNDGYACESY